MSILERAIGVIAPLECLSCGLEGNALCEDCQTRLSAYGPRCYLCGALSEGSKTCERCYRMSGLRYVWVATEYQGLAKQLIRNYKFGHQRAAAGALAGRMIATMQTYGQIPEKYIVVGVPTASRRLRQRGFDHASELARRVAMRLNLPWVEVLGRLGQTQQVGTNRAQRARQLEGQFWLRRPRLVEGCCILLVDDVVTTGATLRQAAKVLRVGGAKSVDGLVFSKKIL